VSARHLRCRSRTEAEPSLTGWLLEDRGALRLREENNHENTKGRKSEIIRQDLQDLRDISKERW